MVGSHPRYAPREREIIEAAASRGLQREQIVPLLLAEGFRREVDALRHNLSFQRGRRAYEDAQGRERRPAPAAARVAAPLRGVRHHLFPGVTLPRLSIQAGWTS